MQTANIRHPFAKFDISAPTCHIGGNSDPALLACFCNNFCFFLVMLCIEHRMLDTFFLEHIGYLFRDIYRNSTDQHRLSLFMKLFNLTDDSLVFGRNILVNKIREVVTDHIFMGRDYNHIKVINFLKFCSFCICRTCHASKLFIKTEIILKGNGGQCLIFLFDFNAFLCLQSLMQAVTVTAARHGAAGEFVNDHHFAVLDQIVNIILEQEMCLQALV